MKVSNFVFIALFGALVVLVACNSKKEDAATTQTTENQDVSLNAQAPAEPGSSPQTPIQVDPQNATPPVTTINPVTTPPVAAAGAAQNAKGDYHFTCPKGCPGGAGAQAKCAKCGADLAHNQAFHAQ